MLCSPRRLKADAALLAVAFVWGLTFVTVKSAIQDIGVFSFLAVRFAIAFIFLAAIFWRKFTGIHLPTWRAGLIIGLCLFAGYTTQTAGLLYTTASNSGFITGLAVVLVPCFAAIIERKLPGIGTWTGVTLAVVGLALLTLTGGLALNYGDILTLLCAISFALQIYLVGHYAPKSDPILLAIIQIGVVALLSGITAAAFETWPAAITDNVWMGLAITAIPATALAFLIQNKAQQFTTPTRTAIIFASEPVFAALTGVYFLGESLTLQQIIGCVLIIAGTLACELIPDSRQENAAPNDAA